MNHRKVKQIARICHEVARIFCKYQGDPDTRHWDTILEIERESYIQGIIYILSNPDSTPRAMHANWYADKKADGWCYGDILNTKEKTHPFLVSWQSLHPDQKTVDAFVLAIVTTFMSGEEV